ncbi:LysR family transcriptional regulator [Ilumatobacter nonamiensis]|uniref:LysR family transcriptional regulator n=1 Tax=Ilumatobacter nonamiensis TaxID=467093 RepID=UPI00034C48C1|nr:LysR family transcriptional regulator [Ilumatobacter nonamiensis]
MTPALQLDVESLRTLLAALDHGGMTRAAERLNMSQSSVSWKIKRLEERIGRPLLIRDGHTLRPTRDGRALIPDARALVEIHDRAASRLQSSELTGTVKLGSNEEVDAAHMASLLGRFKWAHPNASIEFIIDYTTNLARGVDRGELDVAIMQVAEANLRPTDRVLWSDRLLWVTSHANATDDAGPVPLITFGEQCFYRSLSEPDLNAANIDHLVAFSASTTRGVRAALAAGLGVAVLGSRHLGDDIIEWPRSSELPELPLVHQIARTVPGEAPAVATALVDAIAGELLSPSYDDAEPISA